MSGKGDSSSGSREESPYLEAFMKSKDRLRILERAVENARHGIVITDSSLPDNPIVYANRAFVDLTGYSLDEVLGQNCRFLQGSERDQEGLSAVREAIRNGRPCLTLLKNFRKNGTPFWNELSIAPVFDSGNRLINFIGIQNDVSARKEAEKRVAEFYSMISHELRTPLASIRASLGLIEDGSAGAVPDRAARLISIALRNTEKLVKLVDDVLDLKRIEAGKLELSLELVDAAALVSDVITSLKELAGERGITLACDASQTRPFCADSARLSQVLTNLIGNAIKFAPEASTIRVAIEQDSFSIRFSVADEGPGIPENQMEKVFEKFQQLDSSDTRAHPGSGLGLAICKLLVEAHGGHIGVRSCPGAGSTFWFSLPLAARSPEDNG